MRTRTFEGVEISWLLLVTRQPRRGQPQIPAKTLRDEGPASGTRPELGALEVSFGFFHKKTISGRELDANSIAGSDRNGDYLSVCLQNHGTKNHIGTAELFELDFLKLLVWLNPQSAQIARW